MKMIRSMATIWLILATISPFLVAVYGRQALYCQHGTIQKEEKRDDHLTSTFNASFISVVNDHLARIRSTFASYVNLELQPIQNKNPIVNNVFYLPDQLTTCKNMTCSWFDAVQRWPSVCITVLVDDRFTDAEFDMIKWDVDYLNAQSHLKMVCRRAAELVKLNEGKQVINVLKDNDSKGIEECWSLLGYVPFESLRQPIVLSSSALKAHLFVKLLLQTLGVTAQFNREDRSYFASFDWSTISQQKLPAYIVFTEVPFRTMCFDFTGVLEYKMDGDLLGLSTQANERPVLPSHAERRLLHTIYCPIKQSCDGTKMCNNKGYVAVLDKYRKESTCACICDQWHTGAFCGTQSTDSLSRYQQQPKGLSCSDNDNAEDIHLKSAFAVRNDTKPPTPTYTNDVLMPPTDLLTITKVTETSKRPADIEFKIHEHEETKAITATVSQLVTTISVTQSADINLNIETAPILSTNYPQQNTTTISQTKIPTLSSKPPKERVQNLKLLSRTFNPSIEPTQEDEVTTIKPILTTSFNTTPKPKIEKKIGKPCCCKYAPTKNRCSEKKFKNVGGSKDYCCVPCVRKVDCNYLLGGSNNYWLG